jgi:hypothetical protein
MTTILDLCRQLPASEPELRARVSEFNEAVGAIVFRHKILGRTAVCYVDGEEIWPEGVTPKSVPYTEKSVYLQVCHCDRIMYDEEISFGHSLNCQAVLPDYINSIADAKAATDALRDQFSIDILDLGSSWSVRLDGEEAVITVRASTEPLARAACALLGAKQAVCTDRRRDGD